VPPDDECCQVTVNGKRCANQTLNKTFDVCKSHRELSKVPLCCVPGCQSHMQQGCGGLCNSHYIKKKSHVLVPHSNFKPIHHSEDLKSLCATSHTDVDSSDTNLPDMEKHQANEHNETDKESSSKKHRVDCDEIHQVTQTTRLPSSLMRLHQVMVHTSSLGF
jgi:hypothetical protein